MFSSKHLDRKPARAGVNLVERRDDSREPGVLAASRVRAGVRDEVTQAERLGALQFVDERVDRLCDRARRPAPRG